MTKTLFRCYDKDDQWSMRGKCYFVVLPGTWEELSDYDYESLIRCITNMGRQRYTSYAVGTADIKPEEMYGCEIMAYEMQEVHIDADRLENVSKYMLPDYYWKY